MANSALINPAKSRNLAVFANVYGDHTLVSLDKYVGSAYDTINIFQCDPSGGGAYQISDGYINNISDARTLDGARAAMDALIAAGKAICISIGGGSAGHNYTTQTEINACVTSVKHMVEVNFPNRISGIDLNFFESGYKSGDVTLCVDIARQLKAYFGAGFRITADPASGSYDSTFDQAYCVALVAAGVVDYVTPQFYDDGSLWDPVFMEQGIANWIDLLRRNTVGGAYVRTSLQAQQFIGQALGAGNYGAGNYSDIGGGPIDSSGTYVGSKVTVARNFANYPNLRGVTIWDGVSDYSTAPQNDGHANGGTIAKPHPQWYAATTFSAIIGPPAAPAPTPVITIGAPSITPSVANPGSTITVSVVVTVSGAATTAQSFTLTNRPPGVVHGSPPYNDFYVQNAVSLPIGSRTFTSTYTFAANAPIGSWDFYAVLNDSNGTALPDGPSNIFTVQSVASATPPTASFILDKNTGNIPLTITATNTTTGTAPITYSWQFDGNVNYSTLANPPPYTITLQGAKLVKLTATNVAGTSTSTQIVGATLASAAPVTSFTSDIISGNAPLTVQFTDTSTNGPTTFLWSAPGANQGGTSTQRNPVFTYPNAGVFTVTLTTSNPGGSNTTTRTNYITVVQGVQLPYAVAPPPLPNPFPQPTPIPPLVTPKGTPEVLGFNPQVVLQYSDDGVTWSDEIWLPAGQLGEYGLRVQAWQLGSGRTRIFRIRCYDAIPWRLSGASLDLEVGAH
jgi:PKD repeat protein